MKQCRCGIQPLFPKVHWTALSSSCSKGKANVQEEGFLLKSLGLGDSPGDPVAKTPCFQYRTPRSGNQDLASYGQKKTTRKLSRPGHGTHHFCSLLLVEVCLLSFPVVGPGVLVHVGCCNKNTRDWVVYTTDVCFAQFWGLRTSR